MLHVELTLWRPLLLAPDTFVTFHAQRVARRAKALDELGLEVDALDVVSSDTAFEQLSVAAKEITSLLVKRVLHAKLLKEDTNDVVAAGPSWKTFSEDPGTLAVARES